MRIFPKDCPKGCKYLRSWDLSIDDWTYVCTKLNMQIDGCDYLSPFSPLCPLGDDDLEQITESESEDGNADRD